jgi:hypothetical protein
VRALRRNQAQKGSKTSMREVSIQDAIGRTAKDLRRVAKACYGVFACHPVRLVRKKKIHMYLEQLRETEEAFVNAVVTNGKSAGMGLAFHWCLVAQSSLAYLRHQLDLLFRESNVKSDMPEVEAVRALASAERGLRRIHAEHGRVMAGEEVEEPKEMRSDH